MKRQLLLVCCCLFLLHFSPPCQFLLLDVSLGFFFLHFLVLNHIHLCHNLHFFHSAVLVGSHGFLQNGTGL